MLLLLIVSCGTGAVTSFRLIVWASSKSSSVSSSGRGELESQEQEGHHSVSLGPDSIPSVLLVDRQPPLPSISGLPKEVYSDGLPKGLGHDTGYSPEEVGSIGETEGEKNKHRQGCRNTVQGMTLLADSEGRVCPRAELDTHRPGCCAVRPSLAEKGGALPSGNAVNKLANRRDDDSFLPEEIQVASSKSTEESKPNRRGGRFLREHIEVAMEQSVPRREDAATAAGGGSDGEGDPLFSPPEEALSLPFSCWTCDVGGDEGSTSSSSSCCRSYEFCVSCCQDPDRAEERKIIGAAVARSGHPAYLDFVVDRIPSPHLRLPRREGGGREGREGELDAERDMAFAYCAFRCRTYSGSVAHENSFRSPLKYCFGRFRPPVSLDVILTDRDGEALEEAGVRDAVVRTAPTLQLDHFIVTRSV